MQGIESGLANLEDGQTAAMRNLARDLSAALEDAEASLQVCG